MSSKTIEQLKWRYATKRFDPAKKLTAEKLKTLKESFNLTATSFGLQPLKLVVLNNSEVQNQLMAFTYNQAPIRDASHVLILCIEKKIDKHFILDHFKRVRAPKNASQIFRTL